MPTGIPNLHISRPPAVQSSLAKTRLLLVPPNPKLFVTATETFFSCAVRGTRLNATAGSGLCKLNVAGTVLCDRRTISNSYVAIS